MKYNYAIEMLKLFAKALIAPMSISNNLGKGPALKYQRDPESNNIINNSIYAEPENSNIEYNQSINKEFNESVSREDSGFFYDNKSNDYHGNKNNGYYNKQQDTSSNPQGVIDSIAQELTSVRLKQAIILSEIVGKPRSKTRRKRRF